MSEQNDNLGNVPESAPEDTGPTGPSFPYGGMIVIFLVLVVAGVSGRASWWGIIPHVIAIGLMGWGGYETVSRKSYEDIVKQYPRETRLNWVMNSLLCYLVLPGLIWLIIGAPALYAWFKR